MSTRTSAILLALALGLGAYVYFFERGELPDEKTTQLFSFEPGSAVAVELPVGETRARIERQAAQDEEGITSWRLRDPLDFPADAGSLERLLETLSDLESVFRVEPEPADLEAFGLGGESGAIEVFTESAPQEPFALRIGGGTPLPGSRYVRVEGAGAGVFAISESDASALQPDLFELRDKRIARTSRDEVTRVRVFADGIPVVALERERAEGEAAAAWWIREPIAEQADARRVRRALDDLLLARASRFIDEFDEGEAYGLKAPRVRVELESDSGTESIAIGKADENAYARVEGRDVIFETAARLADAIPLEVLEYRDRRVLEVDSSAVERIELLFPRDGTEQTFERREGSFVATEGGASVDAFKLDDLLFAVADLEARDILDVSPDRAALGLDPPRVRVVLRSASEELGWLELGDPDPDLGIAALSSRGERLWRVSNDLGREVPLGQEAFVNAFQQTPPDPPLDEQDGGDSGAVPGGGAPPEPPSVEDGPAGP